MDSRSKKGKTTKTSTSSRRKGKTILKRIKSSDGKKIKKNKDESRKLSISKKMAKSPLKMKNISLKDPSLLINSKSPSKTTTTTAATTFSPATTTKELINSNQITTALLPETSDIPSKRYIVSQGTTKTIGDEKMEKTIIGIPDEKEDESITARSVTTTVAVTSPPTKAKNLNEISTLKTQQTKISIQPSIKSPSKKMKTSPTKMDKSNHKSPIVMKTKSPTTISRIKLDTGVSYGGGVGTNYVTLLKTRSQMKNSAENDKTENVSIKTMKFIKTKFQPAKTGKSKTKKSRNKSTKGKSTKDKTMNVDKISKKMSTKKSKVKKSPTGGSPSTKTKRSKSMARMATKTGGKTVMFKMSKSKPFTKTNWKSISKKTKKSPTDKTAATTTTTMATSVEKISPQSVSPSSTTTKIDTTTIKPASATTTTVSKENLTGPTSFSLADSKAIPESTHVLISPSMTKQQSISQSLSPSTTKIQNTIATEKFDDSVEISNRTPSSTKTTTTTRPTMTVISQESTIKEKSTSKKSMMDITKKTRSKSHKQQQQQTSPAASSMKSGMIFQ